MIILNDNLVHVTFSSTSTQQTAMRRLPLFMMMIILVIIMTIMLRLFWLLGNLVKVTYYSTYSSTNCNAMVFHADDYFGDNMIICKIILKGMHDKDSLGHSTYSSTSLPTNLNARPSLFVMIDEITTTMILVW